MNENDEIERVVRVTRTFHCLAPHSVWEHGKQAFIAQKNFLADEQEEKKSQLFRNTWR